MTRGYTRIEILPLFLSILVIGPVTLYDDTVVPFSRGPIDMTKNGHHSEAACEFGCGVEASPYDVSSMLCGLNTSLTVGP